MNLPYPSGYQSFIVPVITLTLEKIAIFAKIAKLRFAISQITQFVFQRGIAISQITKSVFKPILQPWTKFWLETYVYFIYFDQPCRFDPSLTSDNPNWPWKILNLNADWGPAIWGPAIWGPAIWGFSDEVWVIPYDSSGLLNKMTSKTYRIFSQFWWVFYYFRLRNVHLRTIILAW